MSGMGGFAEGLKNAFNVRGTATQKEFVWFVFFAGVCYRAARLLVGELDSGGTPQFAGLINGTLAVALAIVAIRRVRDTGRPIWHLLIPGYNLLLLFADSKSQHEAPFVRQDAWIDREARDLSQTAMVRNAMAVNMHSFFNVETAAVMVASSFPEKCDVCETAPACAQCGKSAEEHKVLASANSDGDYPVLTFACTADSEVKGLADAVLIMFDAQGIRSLDNSGRHLEVVMQRVAPVHVGSIKIKEANLGENVVVIGDQSAQVDRGYFVSSVLMPSGPADVVAWMGYDRGGNPAPMAVGIYSVHAAESFRSDSRVSGPPTPEVWAALRGSNDTPVLARAGADLELVAEENLSYHAEGDIVGASWLIQLKYQTDLADAASQEEFDDLAGELIPVDGPFHHGMLVADALRSRGAMTLATRLTDFLERAYGYRLTELDRRLLSVSRLLKPGAQYWAHYDEVVVREPGGNDLPLHLLPSPAARMATEWTTDDAATWVATQRLVSQLAGGAWFGEGAPTASQVAEVAGNGVSALVDTASHSRGVVPLHNSLVLHDSLRVGLRLDPSRDPAIPLPEAKEGQHLLEALDCLGLAMTETMDGSLIAPSQTEYGSKFLHQCSLHESPSGERYFYWRSSVLVSNRPMSRGTDPVTDCALSVFLPLLLQTSIYLAECPRGATGLTFDRSGSLATGGIPRIPHPVAVLRHWQPVLMPSEDGRTQSTSVPAHVELGYAFEAASSKDELASAVQMAIDSALRYQTTVEDGYRNHSSGVAPEFQVALYSGSAVSETSGQRWIATPGLPELLTRALRIRDAAAANPGLADEVNFALMEYATGLPFVLAVNDWAGSSLRNAETYEQSAAFLDLAVALMEGAASRESQAIRAILEFEHGSRTDATRMLESVLEQGETKHEAAVRLCLGGHFSEQGQQDRAIEHFEWIVSRADTGDVADRAREWLKSLRA